MGIRAMHSDNARSVTRNLRNLPLLATDRQGSYLYSNMMYTVLTQLIETRTERSFASVLQENIFDAVHMHSTCLQPAAAREKGLGERIALGHCWVKKRGYSMFEASDCPEAQGAGSIMTCVNDFILFVKALLEQQKPISALVYQDLVRPRVRIGGDCKWLRAQGCHRDYAAGMERSRYRSHTIIGHDGSIPGFGSRFFFLPEIQFGACIFGNSSDAWTVVTALARDLIDEVIDRSIPESRPTMDSQPPEDVPKATETSAQHSGETATNGSTLRPAKTCVEAEPQVLGLDVYTGSYWNAGYHALYVEISDGKLFIDATDRGMGFTATFAHVSNQTHYTVCIVDALDSRKDQIQAEFVFDGRTVVRMGLRLEDAIQELIWFNKV
jgi:hypothetical protein